MRLLMNNTMEGMKEGAPMEVVSLCDRQGEIILSTITVLFSVQRKVVISTLSMALILSHSEFRDDN